MASQTVDSLLLQTQVDDSGLTQQFNKQIQEVNRLTDQVNRASAAIKPITITADLKGLSAAEQSVSQFFAGFKGAQVGNVVELLQAMNAELAKTGETDFTSKLISQLTEIRSGFAATSTEAGELQAIIDTLGQSKLPTAAAGGGGGPPPPPPVDQFSAFRREAAATNATVAELTATMARGSAGALAYGEGMARTALQTRAVATETEQTARRTAQFGEASRQASLTPFERGLENIRLTGAGARTEIERGTAAFEGHAGSAKRVTTAIAQLAATSVGAEGPVARLAEQALLFGGGELAVVGVAGAVLLLAKSIGFLNTQQREEDERAQRLLTGLRAEVEQLDATEKAVRGLAAARAAEAQLREGPVKQAERFFAPGIRFLDPTSTGFNEEVHRQQVEKLTKALEDERQAQGDLARAEGANLTQSIQLHIATGAQRQRAIDLVKILQSQEGALLAKDEQKIANARLLNALLEALADKQRQQAVLALQQQGATNQNRAQQQAFSAEDAALQAHFNLQKTLTIQGTGEQQVALEAFYAARREIAVKAARADEDAIRGKIAATQAQTLPTGPNADTEKLQRATIVAGLQQELQLRDGALAIQIRQLRATEAQAAAEALNVAQLIAAQNAQRVLAAGGGNRLGGAPPVREDPFFGTNTPTGAGALPAILQGAGQRGVTRDLEAGLTRSQQEARRLNEGLHAVASNLVEIGSAARGIGLIGEFAQQALGGIGGLIGGIGTLRQAAADKAAAATIADPAAQAAALSSANTEKLSGVFSVVSAGLGLVGNILSIGAALDAEHNRIVTENSQRLAELSLRLDRSFQGSAGVQKAAGLTGDVASIVSQTLNADALGALRIQDAFNEALKGTGLTLREFEQIVKQTTGIEVLDSKGHVLATTLEQANDAFKKVIETITQLSTDPGAVRSRLETEDKLRIGGRSSDPQVAAVQREREVILQGVNLSAQEEARIRAINLETAKGRAEFLKWEQDLARRAEKPGGITATELGTFKNVDELIQALGLGADAVNAFSDSIHAVTDQTSNIPRSFKQFAAASAAEIAGLGPNVPRQPETPRLRGTDISIPLPPELRGTDGASLPAFVTALKESTLSLKAVKEKPAQITGNTVNNTFNVQPTDIREFARLVAIEMRKLGTADRSSNSDPWDG